MMWRGWVLIICGFALPTQAQEYAYNFYKYSAWQRLPPEMRAVYVGGALDILTGVAATDTDKRIAGHYAKCLNESALSFAATNEPHWDVC